MKCTIPEISWHNRDPVLSVDIQPVQNDCYKLATGGTDCHVLIWNLKICENGSVDLHVVSDLSRHQRSVNVVRWSPFGTYLASGDDDANIIIWNLRTEQVPLFEEATSNEECWVVFKILRGHKEDVYDISWSPNETKLVSGSIDNTAILWDFNKGHSEFILSDHKGFVQGVNWDPKGEFIATISSDRVCRIFDNTGKHVRARIHKGNLPVPEYHALHEKEIKYFHDDTFKSYFRRLAFSPDGNLLIVPSGSIDVENDDGIRNATYIFSICDLGQPVAFIPSSKQVTIAVRCCPMLFELHSDGPDPVIDLPYRMIIAIATDSDVILYDTQQVTPFAHFRKVHYTRITDLTWSSDGLLLIASSTDGFCTLITFEPGEVGTQYIKEDSEPEDNSLNVSGCEELNNVEEISKKEVEVKKPNILEKWTVRTPKRDTADTLNKNVPQKSSQTDKEKINRLVPKRIVPTKIGNVSNKDDKRLSTNPTLEKASEEIVPSIITITENSSGPSNSSENEGSTVESKNKHKVESKKTNINPRSSILSFFQVTTKSEQNSAESIKNGSSDPSLSSKTVKITDIIELSDSDSNSIPNTLEIEKENMETKPDSPDRSNLIVSTNTVEAKVNAVKTPRRIPFITLASPKRKKKE
ncbi:hypothetical protein RN001_004573 [Aquatica leii]|uniref:CAF1B/HIR1 beta-propeller domain-containing protein n=1 Tax=Aquatica leii TaxID=1421715 RepID=A0AAN7PYN8_9COLE|nr:hypothetical protein RN001_004573 [Aquatica leii]